MADEKKKAADASGGDVALLACVGLVAALIVIVPVALGWLIWWLLRRSLGKTESLILLGLAGAATALASTYVFGTYATWLGSIVTAATGGSWAVVVRGTPVLALMLFSAVIAAILGVVTNTGMATRFGRILPQNGTVVSRKGPLGRRRPITGADLDDLLDASDREAIIERSNVVAPPGGAPMISADDHSIMNPTAPGKRRFPIGLSAQGTPVYLTEKEIGTHGLILGATGSGKSETIKALVGNLLDLGWSGLLLDLKEDTAPGGLRDWCVTYTNTHGTPYQELRLSDEQSPYWFNTLHGMGADEMRDAILGSQTFEAAYYEALNKELLGQLVNLMWWAHQADPNQFPYPSMYDMAKICGSGNLPTATKKMRAFVLDSIPGVTEDDFRVLANPDKAKAEAAAGFGSRLGNIYESQAGRTVLRQNAEGTRRLVDVTNGGLTYIGLDSQGKADLTAVISSAVLQRLSAYAAARTTGKVEKGAPRFVIIDEANWINRTIVQNLLSRARGAGIALFLCTQGPKDWIDEKGDDWGTLTQNINVAIIMRQGEPDSATICAEYFGKKKRQRTSESISQTTDMFGNARRANDVDRFTVSEELDYVVPPESFRHLKVGQAYIRVGVPDLRAEFLRIQMRDPAASPYRPR